MAGGLYSAGKVAVDVVPDTSLFWAKLHADLASRHPEVKIGVNMDGVAKAERQLNRLDGRTLTNVVKIEGDDSGIRRIGQQLEKVRKEWEKRPVAVKYELDDTAFPKQLKALQTKAKATGVFSKDTSLTDSLWDSMTRLRVLQAKYQQDAEKYAKQRTKLRTDEQAMYAMFGEEIDGNRKRIDQLNKSITDTNNVLEWSKNRMKELRAEGDKAGADWFKNTRIPELRDQLKALKQDLRDVNKELKANEREQSKLFGKEYEKKISDLGSLIEQNDDKWAKAAEAEAKYTNSMQRHAAAVADFQRETGNMVSTFRRSLDLQEDADKVAKEYAKTLPKVSEGEQALADALSGNTGLFTDLSGAASDAGGVMERNRQTARDLTDVLGKQEDQIRGLAAAIEQFKPMGIDKLTGKQFNQTLRQIQELKDAVSKRPVEMKMRLDKGDWDREYADVLHKAEELRSKLEREHEVDVRVKVWDDNADSLEQRLDRLRHTRLDVPVDWQVDQEQLIQAMRETAAKIKANPDRRWELEADLDVDMRHAEEKLKHFEDKNNELKMDLDLETALARAHLAYFTRPRTIDIFANFKGTDLGKIFNGATFGATGLKGVQNEFQKLVTMFDSLDKVVPKWSLLGAGVTALGAGLLNLGRTAGGVGTSILSMSKAALAAPAALTGLGAAGFVAYSAMKTMSSQFDITRTKLAGLQADVGKAFWAEAGQAITSMADSVNDDLRPALVGIATSEGQLVAGLMKVIEQSNAADQLPRIFANTDQAIQALNPGVQSLARAFLGLGDQSSQYLPRMASYVSNVADGWARWVDTASKTGQINNAMQDAIEQGGYLKSSVTDLIGVLGGLFRPLAENQNGLQVFAENIHKANDAVNSVRFQETMQAWVDGATAAQAGLRNSFKDVGDAFYSLRAVTTSVFADAGQIVGSGITAISRVLQQSGTGIRDFSNGVRDGFTEAFKAIGDAGPMFSELASMVGSMSRTFGGTFAASLRAAAPLITTLAKGAEVLSSAFSKLPEPLQAAMGLWVTFGRAGVQAFTSLKMGMLQNIQQTMQYQRMLSELGLSADKAGVSMRTLVSALNQVRSGSYAGALSGAVAEVNALGTAAQSSSGKILAVNTATKETAGSTLLLANSSGKMTGSIENVGNSASKTVGKFSGLKTAASGLVGVLGGPWGIAATAAFMGISAAAADYTAKAQATEAATQSIASAMDNVSVSAGKAGEVVSNLGQAMSDAFKNPDYAEGGMNWLNDFKVFGQKLMPAVGGNATFDDTASAARQLGVNLSDLTKIVQNGGPAYDEFTNSLFKGTHFMDANYQAANKVKQSTDQMVKDMRDQIQTTAEANGHNKQYVDTLMSLGNATDFMALKAKSAAAQQADFVKAGQMAVQTAEDETNARIRAAQAASSYQQTLSQMGSAISQVQSLAAQGQQVWDATAKSFDYTTEAGRTASNAITSLASSANDYMTAMIDSGASAQQVSDVQKTLAQQVGDTANQLTNGAAGAADYANSLLMTPKQISTQVEMHAEEAKNSLLQYVNLLEKTFPNSQNGQATFNTVMNMVNTGAITSMDQVMAKKNELMQGLKDGTMVITVDADGNKAVATMDTVAALGGKLQEDGSYKVNVDATDLASPKINELVSTLDSSGLNGKQITMFLNASGNAKLSVDQVKNSLDQLGLSDKDIEIFLNAQGNAPEQTELIRQKLQELGASPKEIDWFLNAIDQTLAGTSSAQKNIDGVQQKQPASIKSQDDTKNGTSSAQKNIDLVKQKAPAPVDTKDNTAGPTDSAKKNIDSVKGKDVEVKAKTSGLGAVQDLSATIAGLKSKTVTITSVMRSYFQSYGSTSNNYAPGVSLHPATGGRISGPGTGTSDSIPAMVSNGEMVIRASSVRKLDRLFGKDFLDSLNAYGRMPANSPSPASLKYRARSYALASGGRVNTTAIPDITVTPVINANVVGGGMDVESTQAAVASGVSAALKASQMKLAFDARGAARVMAEPMSHEIGLLERSGRIR